MCWQVEASRDLDRVRTQLREDLGRTRDRRVRLPIRAGAWAGLAGLATALGEPLLAVPAVALFEGLVVPRVGRKLPPSIGPLRPWQPPDSYTESPEAPALWAARHR
jgi:hypothetical protein